MWISYTRRFFYFWQRIFLCINLWTICTAYMYTVLWSWNIGFAKETLKPYTWRSLLLARTVPLSKWLKTFILNYLYRLDLQYCGVELLVSQRKHQNRIWRSLLLSKNVALSKWLYFEISVLSVGPDSVLLNYIYVRGTYFNVHLFRVLCE